MNESVASTGPDWSAACGFHGSPAKAAYSTAASMLSGCLCAALGKSTGSMRIPLGRRRRSILGVGVFVCSFWLWEEADVIRIPQG